MDLRINSKSNVPVHVQLEGQLKHLILTGGFEVGSRLPSIRAMAGFLRVNRNTVARGFSDLERVMDLAAAQGVPVEDLAYELLARSGAEPQDKLPVLFVECTRAELDQFSSELEEQLPVEVEKVLVEDLADRVSDAEELPWRLAVTTFFHIHEVQEIMEPRGIETVALLAEATLESLQRLTELPSGTPVGVVGWGRTCMENLSSSLEGAGLDHLDFVQVYVDQGAEEVLATLGSVRAAVCSSVTARILRELGVPE